jgi:hypothetical protein
MHWTKGLEFDYAAVVAPKSYVGEQSEDNNQRQLLYVALTQAKRGTILVLCLILGQPCKTNCPASARAVAAMSALSAAYRPKVKVWDSRP